MKLKILAVIIALTVIFVSCGKDDDKDNNGPTAPQNTAPVLTEVAGQTINAGETKNLELSATDADGDSLNFSIPTNPGFLSISGFSQTGDTATATLIIAPDDTTSGTFNATVKVSDGNGGTDSTNFSTEVQQMAVTPGEWTGNNMSFFVASNGLKLTSTGSTLEQGASMIVRIPIDPNPYGVTAMTFYKYDDIPITGGSINYDDGVIKVDGEFASTSSASGTSSCDYYSSAHNYTFKGSGTWDAIPSS